MGAEGAAANRTSSNRKIYLGSLSDTHLHGLTLCLQLSGGSEVRTNTQQSDLAELLHLGIELDAIAREVAQLALQIHGKANFDPTQPRVPRGHSQGGRWTSGTNGQPASQQPAHTQPRQTTPRAPSGGLAPRDIPAPGSEDRPSALSPRTRPTFDVYPPREQQPLPKEILDSAPHVPPQKPVLPQQRFTIVREIARWAAKVAAKAGIDPRRLALHIAIEGATWIAQEYWPYIEEYLAPPRTLRELQADVRVPRRGTEVHHIVEQGDAVRGGYDRSRIDHPDNLVRISTLRHWQLTAWYQYTQPEYGSLSPRNYLRDKPWQTRYEIGLEALRKQGILAP